VSVDDGDVVIVNNGTLRGPVANITAAETVIRDGRELQGQSEHLFNLQLGYETFDGRSRAALLYNYTSERIRSAELLTFDSAINEVVVALPSVIEEVPSSLDFVYSRTVELADADWDIGFSVRNILGDGYEATAVASSADIELPVDTYDVGTSFGFSISRTW
jgi:outer membrane receptor protein involved in Fe transport